MDKKNATHYELKKVINKTESTTIYLAYKNFMSFKNIIRQVNLKKITDEEKKALENEININSLLSSKFILKIEETYQQGDTVNIVSEYFQGGTLKDYLQQEKKKDRRFLKEEIIWKIFIQICLGLYKIHSKNIIHRSIKPATIFLDSKFNVKITHFKNAYLLTNENQLCKEVIGTKYYMSPEMWLGEGYNTKSDIWALGVTLYEMCMFVRPFEDKTEDGLKNKVINVLYTNISNKYSKELIGLIDSMLKKKMEERPSIKDIIHKYVFISRSKDTDLYDYVDKIINPKSSNRGRPMSSCPGNKRPISGKNKKHMKEDAKHKMKDKKVKVNQSVDLGNDKKNEGKKNLNVIKCDDDNSYEKLTKDFYRVREEVSELIGKEEAKSLFDELSDSNIDEICVKYGGENVEEMKYKNLYKLIKDYVRIMEELCKAANNKKK